MHVQGLTGALVAVLHLVVVLGFSAFALMSSDHVACGAEYALPQMHAFGQAPSAPCLWKLSGAALPAGRGGRCTAHGNGARGVSAIAREEGDAPVQWCMRRRAP